jgi:hypothetical protein
MAATLLKRCVDSQLTDLSWMRLATCPVLKCFEATMKYGEHSCATRALSMYVSAKVTGLPKKPTTEDVCAASAGFGKPLRLLYDRAGQAAPDRSLIFGTVPAEDGDQNRGAKGFLIPIKTSGGTDVRPVYQQMNELLESGVKRMILIVFNSALYPIGHCLLVCVTKKSFVLSDPFLPAGTCVVLPSKEALLLLMSSATTILGH